MAVAAARIARVAARLHAQVHAGAPCLRFRAEGQLAARLAARLGYPLSVLLARTGAGAATSDHVQAGATRPASARTGVLGAAPRPAIAAATNTPEHVHAGSPRPPTVARGARRHRHGALQLRDCLRMACRGGSGSSSGSGRHALQPARDNDKRAAATASSSFSCC
jgi:hypothetical protein